MPATRAPPERRTFQRARLRARPLAPSGRNAPPRGSDDDHTTRFGARAADMSTRPSGERVVFVLNCLVKLDKKSTDRSATVHRKQQGGREHERGSVPEIVFEGGRRRPRRDDARSVWLRRGRGRLRRGDPALQARQLDRNPQHLHLLRGRLRDHRLLQGRSDEGRKGRDHPHRGRRRPSDQPRHALPEGRGAARLRQVALAPDQAAVCASPARTSSKTSPGRPRSTALRG